MASPTGLHAGESCSSLGNERELILFESWFIIQLFWLGACGGSLHGRSVGRVRTAELVTDYFLGNHLCMTD